MSTGEVPIIHVVDDDAAFRKAVSRLVAAKGYRVVSYASAEEFIAANVSGYGCILLDVRMPGLSGLQMQQQVNGSSNLPPIIFVSGHGNISMSVMAMKAGADDFLSKPVPSEQLFNAIASALERSAQLCSKEQDIAQLKARFALLTPRETEVMEHVIRGRLNKQIAFDLGTTERTIKAHRQQVKAKMGARSAQDLLVMAQKLGH